MRTITGRKWWVDGVVALALVLGFTDGTAAQSVLNFPRLANQPDTITGVAFVNPNGVAAPLTLTAYDGNGAMIQGAGITNPANLEVPPNQQVGMLTSQLFGNGLAADTVAWFQATSPVSGITGFFLFLNNAGTQFDGADLPPLDRKINFNQIRVADGFTTELNIFNTEELSTRIDLQLFDGDQIFELDPDNIDFEIPGKGVVRLDVGTLFGTAPLTPGAYLQVVSDTNVGGFQFVRGPTGDLLGLNARSTADYLNTIFFPQLAVLGPWLMEIGLVNYSNEPASLVITAFQPDGRPFGQDQAARNSVVRNLPGGASLRENVETLFGFSGDDALSGWIKVDSTNRAINGYVSYGVPSVGSVAAVAAVSQPQRQAIFSHIATTLGFFTGVAALNPSATAANVRFVALTAGGQVLGSADRVLKPGERISELITQLIPAAAGQAGGVIWVSCDVPLYLTSLFGTNTGSVLANIPPQPAPESYTPDAGIARLTLMPPFAVTQAGGQIPFAAMGASGALTWAVMPGLSGPVDAGMIGADGLYQAPDPLDGSGSATVSASEGELVAGASVDLLVKSSLSPTLDSPGPLAYLRDSDRLYAAVAANGPAASPQLAPVMRSTIVEVTDQGAVTVATLAGEDVTALLPFVASDGSEFLLAAGGVSGSLWRIDPANGQMRQFVTGLDRPGALAEDGLTGAIWSVDNSGVRRISHAWIESDLVSGLETNGSAPRLVVEANGIGAVASDGCSGKVYYSVPGANEVRQYDPITGTTRLITGAIASPNLLLGLQRYQSSCDGSFQLLVEDQLQSRLVLLDPADSPDPISWIDAAPVAGMTLLDAGNSRLNAAAVLFTEAAAQPAGAGGGNGIAAVQVPDLYQSNAINPPQAPVGILADPVSDNYNSFEGRIHDIVEMTAESDGTNLNIQITFADTISPCEQADDALDDICDSAANPPDAATGFVDLDLDQDPLTGLSSFADPNMPYSSRLGAEICIDFFRYNTAAGGVQIFEADGADFFLVGRVPVTFGSHSLSLSIPLALLQDDGRVNLVSVFGTAGPTDAAPNGGFLESAQVNGAGASLAPNAARRAQTKKRSRASAPGWRGIRP